MFDRGCSTSTGALHYFIFNIGVEVESGRLYFISCGLATGNSGLEIMSSPDLIRIIHTYSLQFDSRSH